MGDLQSIYNRVNTATVGNNNIGIRHKKRQKTSLKQNIWQQNISVVCGSQFKTVEAHIYWDYVDKLNIS